MANMLISTLVPLGICVVLPVLIVWFFTRMKINNDNKRSEIIIKAIEANNSIDVDALAKSLEKQQKSPEQIQQGRLLRGSCFALSGVAFIVCGLCAYYAEFFEDDGLLCLVIPGALALSVGIGFLIVYFTTNRKNPVPNK